MAQTYNYDITSANIVAVMTVDDLFPAGFQLEMFGQDAAVASDNVQQAETRMSIDGYLVAGHRPAIKVVNITLEPVSRSCTFLDELIRANDNRLKPHLCGLVVTAPSQLQVLTFSNGVLQSYTPAAQASQTMQPRTFTFHFGSLVKAGL